MKSLKNFFIIMFLSSCTNAVTTSSAERLTAKTDVIISANCHGYYEYLPKNYGNDVPEGGYPLLIFIHGVGESGVGNASELPKLLESNLPLIMTSGKFPDQYKFVVLMPQYFSGPVDDTLGYHFQIFPDQIDELLNFAEAHYSINTKRIYLTGVSMGGARCWTYVGAKAEYAERVAAIIPLAAYINEEYPTHAIDDTEVATIAASNLPIWAFHNSTDPISLPQWAENLEQKLQAATPAMSPTALLSLYNPSHPAHQIFAPDPYDPETKGENGMNIYEWMLQFSR